MQFPDEPDAACQGRQARSLGSDVTASSGTAISTDMFGNFVKNSFKFDVALKHAQDEVPVRKSTPEKQKSPLATNKHRRRQRDVPNAYRTRYCVYLWEISITTVKETSVPDVRLSIPVVSCVANSASAGKLRSIFIK